MTATVVLKTASRAVWLKHRTQGLGGTDVAAILGHNPWKTPREVWLDKTGRNPPDDRPAAYAARRGLHLERFLIAEYLAGHPGAILERPPALLAHPQLPWLRASLDHLAHHPDETRVVEVKTAGWRQREAWWDSELLIPDSYAIQVLTYLAVTGLERCDVIADIAGDLTEITIARDPQWEAETLPELEVWWTKYVKGDEPPPLDVRDRMPTINRTWVPEPGKTLTVGATDEAIVACALEHREHRDTHAHNYEALRVQIRDRMAAATTMTRADGVVIARIDTRGTLTFPKEKTLS